MMYGTNKAADGTVTVNIDGEDYSIETLPHHLLTENDVDWLTRNHPEVADNLPDIALLRAARGLDPDLN